MPILHWLNREESLTVADKTPYRVLEEVPSLSRGEEGTQNMLVQGDNLDALKSLLPYYAGQVKCIYIDPPYNTGHAFEHYDDNVEHSTWLSLMVPRLTLLRDFLSSDGSIWIQIDDDEMAYLKVICDEIFGRSNFVNLISVNMKSEAGASGGGEDKRIKKNCEYILVYAKNYQSLARFKPVYEYEEIYSVVQSYRHQKKNWHYTSVLADAGTKEYCGSTRDGEGNEIKVYRRINARVCSIKQMCEELNLTEREVYYKFGTRIFEAKDAQSSIRTRVETFKNENGISDDIVSIEYVPRSGKNKGKLYEQFYKGDSCRLFAWLQDICEVIDGALYKKVKQGTYWDMRPCLNNLTKEGNVHFPRSKKPEALVERVLYIASDTAELVMDSFLGSATTAAVAHKMGRQYIGIEMGDHAVTHCVPRLEKVIDGEQGGISKSVGWQGGGGFRFYRLGETVFDEYGEINPDISFDALASHIWFTETYQPRQLGALLSTCLGVHQRTAYSLLYNGVLKDRSVSGGNVLTRKTLSIILEDIGEAEYDKIVVYGESCRLSPATLQEYRIVFKQTPYDVRS